VGGGAERDQPDPWDGSYDLAEPQTFNRYAYVRNDPVNYTDPKGLYQACVHKAMTKFLAKLTDKYRPEQVEELGKYAGDESGGADSFKYAATNPVNFFLGLFGVGPSADIHFASEGKLQQEIAKFPEYVATTQLQKAGFVLHAIQDVHGAHQGYRLPLGHAIAGHKPDRIIGDERFLRAANETFQVLSNNKAATLSAGEINELINAIVTGCGKLSNKLQITRPAFSGGGGAVSGGFGGGGVYPWWWYSMMEFLAWVDSIRVASLE